MADTDSTNSGTTQDGGGIDWNTRPASDYPFEGSLLYPDGPSFRPLADLPSFANYEDPFTPTEAAAPAAGNEQPTAPRIAASLVVPKSGAPKPNEFLEGYDENFLPIDEYQFPEAKALRAEQLPERAGHIASLYQQDCRKLLPMSFQEYCTDEDAASIPNRQLVSTVLDLDVSAIAGIYPIYRDVFTQQVFGRELSDMELLNRVQGLYDLATFHLSTLRDLSAPAPPEAGDAEFQNLLARYDDAVRILGHSKELEDFKDRDAVMGHYLRANPNLVVQIIKDRSGMIITPDQVDQRMISQLLDPRRQVPSPPPGWASQDGEEEDETITLDDPDPPEAEVPLWLEIGRALLDQLPLPPGFHSQGDATPKPRTLQELEAPFRNMLYLVQSDALNPASAIARDGGNGHLLWNPGGIAVTLLSVVTAGVLGRKKLAPRKRVPAKPENLRSTEFKPSTAKGIEQSSEPKTSSVVAEKTPPEVSAMLEETSTAKSPSTKVAGKGYQSFSAFKRAHGDAGEGMAWHHIVEQTPGNLERFGPEAIHNTENLIRLPHGKGKIHNRISGYYSSKRWFSQSETVRQWLGTQSFEEQAAYGRKIIQELGGGQ